MSELREWFDVLVRRPNDDIDTSGELPAPTERYTYSYPSGGASGDGGVNLVLEGFRADSEQAMISSGVAVWEASNYLCNCLLADEDFRRREYFGGSLLELGSGLGKCGLLAHRLYSPTETVLTDGDVNALAMLKGNIELNKASIDDAISCEQLVWGREAARKFLSFEPGYDDKFDMIIASDVLYTRRGNVEPLFETVDILLSKYYSEARFIIAHNEKSGIRVETIVKAGAKINLFHEILSRDGQIYVLCFRRLSSWRVNELVERLQNRNNTLEKEIEALKSSSRYLEDRCKGLDRRCTFLRNDGDKAPVSILLSFDEDNFADIASFLMPKDFACLESTCKLFGLKTHDIGNETASFVEKVVHKLCERATPEEKEALVVNREISHFSLYNQLLELRKPLKFDRLIGFGIEHSIGDQTKIVDSNLSYAVKVPPVGLTRGYAFTAVSGHVMRTGRHYVTFSSPECASTVMFGVVRPLCKLESDNSTFTPLCSYHFGALRQLRSEEWGECNVHCCVYDAMSGQCKWTDWDYELDPAPQHVRDDGMDFTYQGGGVRSRDWIGMQPFVGGTIGMLLDYGKGTLTVFKDGNRRGILQDGLSGAYCWMVAVGGLHSLPIDSHIEIERYIPPADNDLIIGNDPKRQRL